MVRARGEKLGPADIQYEGRAEFKASFHSLRQSLLMEQQRLDTPVLEFWYLVADDLCQHLWEFHAEGFIHEGVETDLEKTLDHLQRQRHSSFKQRHR